MARTKKIEVPTRNTPEAFNSLHELETRLASVSVPNNTKTSPREQLIKTRVLMWKAHRTGQKYSKEQIAAAFKTTKQTVAAYIAAVDNALKTADLVKSQNI